MATTKRYFGITITTMTHVWANTLVRISGDASVAGQIKATANGGVEFNFPERAVLIANHQVCRKLTAMWKDELTVPDLYRLAVSLVGRVRQSTQHARPPLHHLEGVSQVHPSFWSRHDVLRIHLHVSQDEY